MNLLKDLTMVIAAAGFTASAVVHVQALFGIDPAFGKLTWALHIGVFLVFLPAALETRAFTLPRDHWWHVALRGCPAWMRMLIQGLFIYALINFAVFVYLDWGRPQRDHEDPLLWRMFSGHWMVFYSSSFAMLYSARRLRGASPREDAAIVPR
jgi:hypothetical protein